MLSSDDLNVRYILFSHFAKEEFEGWQGSARRKVTDLSGFRFLVSHFTRLAELLDGGRGILVLFFAPGYREFLEGITEGERAAAVEGRTPKLQCARAMKDAIMKEAGKCGQLAQRLRFIIAQDLEKLFARWQKAGNLRRWFIGRTEALRCDSPKMIEAIVRVRHIGSGIPVFRFDHDVIFRGDDNRNSPRLDLGLACEVLLTAHQLRRDAPQISTFLCSAQYDTGGVENPVRSRDFDSWSGAFATRVYPAILVDCKWARSARTAQLRGKPETWLTYAMGMFSARDNEAVARRFYGFTDSGRPVTPEIRGLAKLAAHPLVSVISGAGLNISDSGIMDLPPFCGFRLNVSFIDDHAKYCLHRELRHFTTTWIPPTPLLSDAKLDEVRVRKQRPSLSNLPEYVLGDYLPTLLWGCVMDAWINPDPLIKFRRGMLHGRLAKRWDTLVRRRRKAVPGKGEAVFPTALQKALERGSLNYQDQDRLAVDLEKRALERINEVREEWKRLVSPHGEDTFASVWAKGTTATVFPLSLYFTEHVLPNPERRATWQNLGRGISPTLPGSDPIQDGSQLNPYLYLQLRDLIQDAIEYVEWTLTWPAMVQVIRSVEPGTLATDATWPLPR